MGEDKPKGLQRLEFEQRLPPGFDKLTEEDQRAILRKMHDKHVDILSDLQRDIGRSRIAENDLVVHNDNVERLDHDRKVYTSKINATTGSGNIEMQVRGGDTRFIVPILVVVGVIFLAIVVIVAAL